MARLIDAELYEAFLIQYAKNLAEMDVPMIAGAIEMCISKLNGQPTVDAVEVVHSKWLRHWNNYICDACHSYQFLKSNYCPNCGAKMDGECE